MPTRAGVEWRVVEAFAASRDKVLGEGNIKLDDVFAKGSILETYPLEKGCGSLTLTLEWK